MVRERSSQAADRPRSPRSYGLIALIIALGLALTACPQDEPTIEPVDEEPSEDVEDAESGTETALSGTLRIYTSVTEDTVDAVTTAFGDAHPDVELDVFRAPTGELNARIAAEKRDEGRMLADVLWLTDPLSMQQFEAEGDLAAWSPENIDEVPDGWRTETFFGTRLLNMVLVHGADLDPAPTSWHDLTDGTYRDGVVIPDPGFAGSAFGALAFFALDEDFGFEYYEDLAANGVTQVSAPGEVVTGVAEGRFVAGLTLDKVAFDARDDGSPIEVVFADPGAIAMYSPIAVVETSDEVGIAEAFVEFVLTQEAQEAIAGTGWQPVREDVAWDRDGPTVTVDWDEAFDRQDELLERYRAIIGG